MSGRPGRFAELVGRVRGAGMRFLNRLDSWVRNGTHRILGFLEDRLAPFTVMVLAAVLTLSILFWDSWSGEESDGMAIRNLVLVIAAIAALPLAIWRSKVAERQAETAQRGLLNERYQKGAEMLGSKMLPVRIGGVYALARLAREHPGDYHTQIMSLLCMFARRSPVLEDELSEDVLEVMGVVRERSDAQVKIENEEKCRLDLSEVDLPGVYLESANLSNTDLVYANLSGAKLMKANLSNANLFGALLFDAKLMKCKGLTQEQLDQATVRTKEKGPDLADAFDANTGEPLVWRGAG